MNYAGVGWRAVAVIIDAAVLFAMGYVIALATGNVTATGYQMEGGPVFLLFFLWIVYYIASEATVGATLGKLLLGLRVVKTDGSPAGWQASIVRNVLRIVDGLLIYLVGALFAWQSPQRQRLGDRVAGTVVVRRRAVAVGSGV